MKHLLVFLVLLAGCIKSAAQENLTLYFEPEISVGYQVTSAYTHSFDLENRNFLYKESAYDYTIKHIEIAHTSNYQLKEHQFLGFGIQYRFQEDFDASNENEFRLIQEFAWKTQKSQIEIAQAIKNEQRFYASTTKYRVRYEVGLKFPIKDNANYILAETETLFELANGQKPEFEQRLGGVFGWQWDSSTNLEMGFQYRLADYSQDLGHELFFVLGLDISL